MKLPRQVKPFLELRGIAEIPGFAASVPVMSRSLPKGDGHPVIVVPGFMSNNRFTGNLRKLLNNLGYDTRPWNVDFNKGLCNRTRKKLEQQLIEVNDETGRKVSLLGWSAGGCFARVAAHDQPDRVRQVITFGSPFGIDFNRKIRTAVGLMHEYMSTKLELKEFIDAGLMEQTPPVPSTSILSFTDGIAPWKASLDFSNESTENLVVPGSHIGMANNVFIARIVAERLSQPEGEWAPYKSSGRGMDRFVRSICAGDVH